MMNFYAAKVNIASLNRYTAITLIIAGRTIRRMKRIVSFANVRTQRVLTEASISKSGVIQCFTLLPLRFILFFHFLSIRELYSTNIQCNLLWTVQ